MRLIYSESDIADAVRRLAAAIDDDHRGHEVHLVGVLKGSFLFLADLVRRLRTPCTLDFVRLSSYGAATSTSGEVVEKLPLRDPIAGRRVIVVEEIVDSGLTLAKLLGDLEREGPASLQVCALVDKTSRRETEVPVHYRGMALEDGFLVGYGLDLDERYRNLPAIYEIDGGTTCPTEEANMAIWCCPTCGHEKDARCKPKKCPDCDAAVEFAKKEEVAAKAVKAPAKAAKAAPPAKPVKAAVPAKAAAKPAAKTAKPAAKPAAKAAKPAAKPAKKK